MENNFNYETPPWGAKLICSAYFCVSVFFFSIYYNFESWIGSSPAFIKFFILMLSVVFLLGVLKPSNRRGWVYFSASDKGLYFPLDCQKIESPELHVPWSKVGVIQKETLYHAVYGITIELKLSNEEVNSHFKDLKMVNKFLGFSFKRNGFYVIGYSNNAFQNRDEVVSTLNEIKRTNI